MSENKKAQNFITGLLVLALLFIVVSWFTARDKQTTPSKVVQSKPTATAMSLECVSVPQFFIQELANSLTVTGQGGVAKVNAVKTKVSIEDSKQWYLVGAIITGPGMGTNYIGIWLTNVNFADDYMSGVVFSADSAAKGFSIFPQPQVIWGIYTSTHPDVQAVKKCMG